MKIIVEESLLRQALGVLEDRAFTDTDCESITALRTALNAAEKVEDQLAAVTKERDELVAALKKCSYQLYMLGYSANHADAALAKVGAGKTEEKS